MKPTPLLTGLALLGALGCGPTSAPSENSDSISAPRPTGTAPSFLPWPNEVKLIGAGDIAWCHHDRGDEATAKLLDTLPGTVFTAGDNVYPSGTANQFANCYDPTWGRHKARTRPSPGNHDYVTNGGAPYYAYFGSRAGPAGRGYYSYTVGSWHVFSLNSNISMAAGSAQHTWLKNNLAASTAQCTLAYWHHPLFASGTQVGDTTASKPLWDLLYAAGADLVVVGHEHNYERFAPQTPSGVADASYGLRQFVVGTGGKTLSNAVRSPRLPNSRVFNGTTWGVLELWLGEGGYRWRFVPVIGTSFTDVGNTACHGKPGSHSRIRSGGRTGPSPRVGIYP
jgi:calcineurin-like phosphoesterase family protein